MEPTASLIVITPICSHALNTSSIVLSAEDEIRIEIGEGRHADQRKCIYPLTERIPERLLQGRPLRSEDLR